MLSFNSLRGEAWTQTTSLIPPPIFIEVFVPSQESEQSCIWVLGVSNFFWILELFRQCDIFCFFYFNTVHETHAVQTKQSSVNYVIHENIEDTNVLKR